MTKSTGKLHHWKTKVCCKESCGKDAHCRGMCHGHYKAWLRAQQYKPTATPGRKILLADWTKAHPLVFILVKLCKSQDLSFTTVAKRSGVGKATIYAWKHGHGARIDLIVACYNTIGYELVPQEILTFA